MFADTLAWDSTKENDVEETLSELAQAEERITALNGQTRTLVTIYAGEAHLAVGGDASTGLVVYATFDGETFYQAVTSLKVADGEALVVAGKQPGRHSVKNVVSLHEAILAATSFARDGLLDSNLTWSGQ